MSSNPFKPGDVVRIHQTLTSSETHEVIATYGDYVWITMPDGEPTMRRFGWLEAVYPRRSEPQASVESPSGVTSPPDRPIQVGDTVRLPYGRMKRRVVAIEGRYAWVTRGATTCAPGTFMLDKLEHVPPEPVTVVDLRAFDPWPFKDGAISVADDLWYITSDHAVHENSGFLTETANAIATLSDGRRAITVPGHNPVGTEVREP